MSDPNKGLPPIPPKPATAVNVGAVQGVPVSQQEKQANEITETNNPANEAAAKMMKERGPRLELNAPSRRLDVPPLPGYHLHWFLERNIPEALRGWYEFVTPEEMPTLDTSIGGRTKGATSDDLGGGRLSVISGQDEQGKPQQLVLMKIRQEWFFDSQRKIAERNLSVVQQIFHKKAPILEPGEKQADAQMRYTKEAILDLSLGRFKKA